MMTSQENVSDTFPLSTFQWSSKKRVICNSQFCLVLMIPSSWLTNEWVKITTYGLQTLRAKPIKKVSLLTFFLSHFVLRQHLMDHNFHNVYNRKDDALERWVSFSYRDGFTHRLKKGQTLHQSSIQKEKRSYFVWFHLFLPSQERKFKLEWKFSNRKSWQILLLCLTQTHSILERKWNHSTSNIKKGSPNSFQNQL